MTLAEKLKDLRKQAGLSQEKLAEKIGVSRQAITKWETDTGIPDIENLLALSALFEISVDELLSNERKTVSRTSQLYESGTEYDIDCIKRYDMKLGGAKTLIVRGYDGEKIRVRLTSDKLSQIQSDFKLKIDDVKNRIDVDISRKNEMTEAMAKEALTILAELPNQYISKIELEINAENIELHSLKCDNIELNVKSTNLLIDDVTATVEVDCNLDMQIICNSWQGAVELNQISATSRIGVPAEMTFAALTKGLKTRISYEQNGRPAENFSEPEADNVIELNGLKSELVIYTL